MKRFFKAFAWTRVFLFRRFLRRLFIWRISGASRRLSGREMPAMESLCGAKRRLATPWSGQLYLPGFRPDTIIVTNIGQAQAIDGILKKAGALDYLTTNGLIAYLS